MALPKRPPAPAATIDLTEVGNPKHNAFWFACTVDGGRVNYAVCMTKAAIISTSSNSDGFARWSDCRKAIRCGNCRFVDMRRVELTEGRPIWFVPREGYDPAVDAMTAPAELVTQQPQQKQVQKPNWRSEMIKPGVAPTRPVAKRKPAEDPGYAAAINNYLASTVAEKQRDASPSDVKQNDVKLNELKSVAKPLPQPEGLAKNSSPLERARAMIAAKSTQ